MNKNYLIAGSAIAIMVFGIALFYKPSTTGNFANANLVRTELAGETFQVFYGSGCGCCVKYITYLKEQGLNVKATRLDSLYGVKTELGVPREMQSCHTVKIGGYFVEGHVPIEAIQKLLQDKPDIDGIALPGMPSGSPGMPGTKTTFTIYSVKNGENVGVFMKL